MLRYYDEMELLKPAETDRDTGYRYYSVEQIPVLNRIVFLRDAGFRVAEIRDAMMNWETQCLVRRFDRKQEELEEQIREQREKFKRLEQARQENRNGGRKALAGAWRIYGGRTCQSNGRYLFYFHDTDYREEEVDVELCVRVEKRGGDRDGFIWRGPNRQIVLRGSWNEPDPGKYLTEIQITVTI